MPIRLSPTPGCRRELSALLRIPLLRIPDKSDASVCGRGRLLGGGWRAVTHGASGLEAWMVGWMVHLPELPNIFRTCSLTSLSLTGLSFAAHASTH